MDNLNIFYVDCKILHDRPRLTLKTQDNQILGDCIGSVNFDYKESTDEHKRLFDAYFKCHTQGDKFDGFELTQISRANQHPIPRDQWDQIEGVRCFVKYFYAHQDEFLKRVLEY